MAIARARALAGALAERRREGLQLYRPLPALVDFHSSNAHWRIVFGSNRGGKTLAACTELARAVTGQDPYEKYPKTNGRALVVAMDEEHLGNPIWTTLAKPGGFKTMRDPFSREWRSVGWKSEDPKLIDPGDLRLRHVWQDSEPLIPSRMIVDIAWEKKAQGIPRWVKLSTGWEIMFRSGKGDPPRGIQLNVLYFDEEFLNQKFYAEGCARLVDRRGVGIWAATPDVSSPQFAQLLERGNKGQSGIETYFLFIEHNPYLPPEARQELFDSLTTEEDRQVKYYGRATMFGRRPYRCYRPEGEHGCEPFEIPADWCRYVFVDPARMQTGTVMGVVDPEEKHLWIYDAFNLTNADASRWAAEIAQRQGEFKFEAFVFDKRMGKSHNVGLRKDSVAEQYWTALGNAGVVPRTMGPLAGFFAGSDDIMFREEALLNLMRVRECGPFAGTPKLQVFTNICPDLHREIQEAYYDRDRPEKRVKIRYADLIDALEYGASIDPGYFAPELAKEQTLSPAQKAWADKCNRQGRRSRRKQELMNV